MMLIAELFTNDGIYPDMAILCNFVGTTMTMRPKHFGDMMDLALLRACGIHRLSYFPDVDAMLLSNRVQESYFFSVSATRCLSQCLIKCVQRYSSPNGCTLRHADVSHVPDKSPQHVCMKHHCIEFKVILDGRTY